MFFFSVQSDDDSNDEADDKEKDEEVPVIPEPARDAQLEEAYKLEKEDAGSDEVDSDDNDDDYQENGEITELTKTQKREAAVYISKSCF